MHNLKNDYCPYCGIFRNLTMNRSVISGSGFMVNWSGFVNHGSGMVNGCGFVNNWSGMVRCGFVDHGSGMVNG